MVGKKVQRAFYITLLSNRGRVVAQNVTDVLQYVNPLIGSANGGSSNATCTRMATDYLGNVFAGATLPYGMAKNLWIGLMRSTDIL
jgi:hypothetical protein